MTDIYGNYGVVGVLNPSTPGYEKLATQATLEAILAKLSADPPTQTTLAAMQTTLDALKAIFDAGTAGVTINRSLSPVDTFNRMAYPVTPLTRLTIPTYDGSGQCVHPGVVYITEGFAGYKFWMVFTPYPGSDSAYENPSIVASNDGITWVVPAGVTNPLFGPPAEGYYADPTIAYDPVAVRLYIWWSHNGVSPGKTYMSYSDNGAVWTAATPIKSYPGDANLAFGPFGVAWSNTAAKFTAWVLGSERGLGQIRKYTSADGITWTPEQDCINVFGGKHYHFSTFANAGGIHFLSAAHKNEYDAPVTRKNDLYYGYSMDGNLIVFDSSPLWQPDRNSWTGQRLYQSSMVQLGADNIYRVYVSAQGADYVWSIGYFDLKLNNPQTVYQAYAINQPHVRYLARQLEIRNTNDVVFSPMFEWMRYKHKVIAWYSTLNQAVGMQVVTSWPISGAFSQNLYRGAATPTQETVTLPVGNQYKNYYIDEGELPVLGVKLPGTVELRLKCESAPTSGSITLAIVAWN